MKILVTGATGFIGQHVLNYLINIPNHEILATYRNLDKIRSFSFYDKVKWIKADLTNVNPDIFETLGKPDKLIDLAWEGLPNYKEIYHIDRNLFNHFNFLKLMIEGGLKDLTVAGTCFEYGMIEGLLIESMNTNPENAYAIAKDSLRRFLMVLKKKINFRLKWLRLFYTYGSGQAATSLISQIENAIKNGDKVFNMSGGEQLRDYLPVEKMAEYISRCALQSKFEGIINCASGKPISVKEFVKTYLKQRNIDIELNFGFYPYSDLEPMAFWGDTTKMKMIMEI